jgi:hypothetical protein
MIDFIFSIRTPKIRWKTLWNKSGKTPFPNKYWEFNIYRCPVLISLEFSLKFRTDHAGITLGFGILGHTVEFMIYDNRHWDSLGNCWDEEI